MSDNTPKTSWQLAREVARRIQLHPGESARELYQRYLPEFAAIGVDGTYGAQMIQKHLAKFEEEGLVICEARGKGPLPAKWRWVGPFDAKDEAPAAPAAEVPEMETDAANVGTDRAEAFVPAFTVVEATPPDAAGYRLRGIDGALIQLEQRLNAPRHEIQDRPFKVQVLRRLAGLLDPDIAQCLNAIASDLEAG